VLPPYRNNLLSVFVDVLVGLLDSGLCDVDHLGDFSAAFFVGGKLGDHE
jgi:hypothetical protein